MTTNNPVYAMLNNIYEMENAMIPLLQNQAKDAKNYPHIGKYLKKLLKESQLTAVKAKENMNILEGKVVSSIDSLVGSTRSFNLRNELA